RFWALSSRGLLVESDERLRDYQRPYARPDSEVEGWQRDDEGRIGLAEVVRRVHPTILIGTSGQAASFTEEVVREMAASCERPVILPMSNPTSLSEAVPADLLAWTDGRALVATGSPFDPVVDHDGKTFSIAQANNALVFPGIGLGAILARARRVTKAMLRAGADAVASEIDSRGAGAALLPDVATLRQTSAAVAAAVWRTAVEDGVARVAPGSNVEGEVRRSMWEPAYRPIRAV
ncbi:MAG: malic enzyme-like NAD(P)-binding protein, partial [Acidimicrobiales bacterium]